MVDKGQPFLLYLIMKKLYKRFYLKFVPGDDDFTNDAFIERGLNKQIISWVEQWKQDPKGLNFDYRITNVENMFLPPPAMSPGNPVIYIVVNIEYSI